MLTHVMYLSSSWLLGASDWNDTRVRQSLMDMIGLICLPDQEVRLA